MSEVVTQALVRYLDVPGLDKPFALITLDNGRDHTRPSTFGEQGLASLDRALNDIAGREVSGIGVTGKPYIFAAGADLTAMQGISTADEARTIGQRGHQIFGRLRDAGVPTFAFVNGVALGGGLELALACDYRTLSSSVTAVAFPECFLGLVPGWGGSWLLPNLVGVDAAITVIIDNPLANNRMLRARQALELGIADVLFDPADFVERSLEWAAQVINAEIVVRRQEIDRGPSWSEAVKRARERVDAKLHGAAPAPYRALDLIESARDSTAAQGFAAEDEVLAKLVIGDELRAGLYAFDLVQKRARRPVGAPDPSLARPVTKVGIVGAGLMATQLALLIVRRLQVPVVLTDVDADALRAGVATVHREIAALAAKGRLTADAAARLTAAVAGSPSYQGFSDADLIIEAVTESLDIKRQVFADLDAAVNPQCILATNTSALSVAAIADGLTHPERVAGMHFFNPVAVLPLLEVIRARQTDDATLATVLATGKALRKSCVLVQDAPAFVVNRVLLRMLDVVLAAVESGTPIELADAALTPLGLPMPPFVLLQLVGPAVACHVGDTLHEAYPDRFHRSDFLHALVDRSKPGVYTWDERGHPIVDPDVAALLPSDRSGMTGEELCRGVLDAIADEVRLIVLEGVVAEPADVDMALILGAGWPFHLGGITPYLDRTGVSERVIGRRFQAW